MAELLTTQQQGFEAAAAVEWTASSFAVVSRTTDEARTGVASLLVEAFDEGFGETDSFGAWADAVPIVAGSSYTFSAWGRKHADVTVAVTMFGGITWLDGSMGVLSATFGSTTPTVSSSGWVQMVFADVAAPPGAEYALPTVGFASTPFTFAFGSQLYIDDASMVDAAVVEATLGYFRLGGLH